MRRRKTAVLEFGAGESSRMHRYSECTYRISNIVYAHSTDTLEYTLSAAELFPYFHAK